MDLSRKLYEQALLIFKLDGQLHEKDGSCATSGSKVMTRAVNKLKMRSKTDEVASVGLKNNKACS